MELRMLFIESDPINQSLCESPLDSYFRGGFINTKYTHSLYKAEVLLKQSVNNNTFPHIILCDMQLIEGTGFDFLDIFKQKYLDNYPKTVIALMTAMVTPDDLEKIKNYPFVFDIFIRPINYKYK